MNLEESLFQIWLVNRHSPLFTHLYSFLINVVNDELNHNQCTFSFGFLRASTLVVGKPTKPAPKHETLVLLSINNFRLILY